MSKRWQVQDAKARFSELIETSVAEGTQIVTRRGVGERQLSWWPSASGGEWSGGLGQS